MNEINKCGICLEKLEKTNVCVTSCGHSFCLECILKNSKFKMECPYCRCNIMETIEPMEPIEIIEENQYEPYNYIGHIDNEEECYHFPVVIENIHILAKVINEVTAGSLNSDISLGWILCILAILSDSDDLKVNLKDDISFENEILLADYSKIVMMEAIFIYKRSILLTKHLKNIMK